MRAPLAALALLLLLAAAGRADEPVYPQHSEALFLRYCASCHGIGGTGDGPVADALKLRPTDLTQSKLALAELMKVIDGRRTVRGHGTAAMPVWGRVFEQAREGDPRQVRQSLRDVQALAEYVRALETRRR